MTHTVISFYTEDFVNPIGAEAILRYGRILREHGVKGCYNTVARLAEALVKWGRQDVIEELSHHEIDLHSLDHTVHPTIDEYTDIEDFEAALAEFLRREEKATDIIADIIGCEKSFPAACPPGASTSYVAHYGYHKMGVKVYTGDDLFDAKRGRPVFNCNVASLDYRYCLDQILLMSHEEIDALLDKIAEEKDIAVLYHHPQSSYVTDFWDALNFNGKNTPEEEWVLSERRAPEETELFFENFRYLVEKLLADDRFNFTTYKGIGDIYFVNRAPITLDMLPSLKAQLESELFPVTTPDSYCLSDILLACRDLLMGKEEHICGDVYGFLSEPYGVSEPVVITADELRASASQIGDGFLPERLTVGESIIGPADWLRAALEVLTGCDTVTVEPGAWQIDFDEFPRLRDMDYSVEWLHWDALKDEYLSDRFRMQSWTYRLPKDTARKIF